MTLDEAIHRLKRISKTLPVTLSLPEHNAIKLGIEALKAHKERRQRFPNLEHLKLPGETGE